MRFLVFFIFFLTIISTHLGFATTNTNTSMIICDEHWWKEASIHHLESFITQRGEEQIKNGVCDENGNSPFHLAVTFNPYKEVIDYLLNLDFSTEHENQLGQNVFDLALANENPEILQTLQQHTGYLNNHQRHPELEWYIGGGIESHLPFTIHQFGDNKDTTCYPDRFCFTQILSGYRWHHDVHKDPGLSLEFFVGKELKEDIRVEITFARQKNNLEQGPIEYHGKAPLPSDTNPYQNQINISSNTISEIDDIITHTLSVNFHHDLKDIVPQRVTPNIGFGIGLSHIKINGVRFSTDYQNTINPSIIYNPPLPSYNSHRENDISNLNLSIHLHAGIDFNITSRNVLGLRFTFTDIGSIDYKGYYSKHPMHTIEPSFSSNENFHGIKNYRIMFLFRRM